MRVLEQHTEVRNAFRGNTPMPSVYTIPSQFYTPMPSVYTIPSQFYTDPHTLFLYMHKKFLEHILLATNNRISIKVPDAAPITLKELQQYFCIDHLAHPGFFEIIAYKI